MSKKHKIGPRAGYLKCTECGRVTELDNVQPIGTFMKPQHRQLDCGCQKYSARHVSQEEGFDAIVRQQIEGAAA